MVSPSFTSESKRAPSIVYPKHAYRPSSKFLPAGVRSESNNSQKNWDGMGWDGVGWDGMGWDGVG
jgi:hypothetical protein